MRINQIKRDKKLNPKKAISLSFVFHGQNIKREERCSKKKSMERRG